MRPVSPQASLLGWFDLDRIDMQSSVTEAPAQGKGDARTFDAPGLHCCVRHQHIRVLAFDGGLALVTGSPRMSGAAAAATDSEIQNALRATAMGMPGPRLEGRYSIVHMDRRTRYLTMFTDRFGVHPLCYALEHRRLSFADRADALPTQAEPMIDPQALFNFVYFHVVPAPRTAFRGVLRLTPSGWLRFSDRGIETGPTWKPGFRERNGPEPRSSEFRELLRSAIATEADAPRVGAFLSGGTDSSTVAGMLREVVGAAPDVFSIGFEAEGYDEIAYARIAATHFGCNHHVYYVTPDDVASVVPDIAAYYDQPFGNSSAVPAYYCARLARDHGMDKLLAGDGGDEIFGGNVRYAKQKVLALYSAVLPASVRRAFVEPVFLSGAARALPGVRKVASYIAQARVAMPDRAESYNLLDRYGTENLFTRTFIEAVDAEEPRELQRRVYRESLGAALVDRMLAYDWRFTLADNDLPKVLGSSAIAGLAVGFPLLDDRLVDFSLRLSPSQKVRGLALRHWFKRALSDFLPAEIIRKKKHGFGLPFGPWLIRNQRLQSLARDSVGGLVDRGMVSPGAMGRLFSSDLERYPGYYGEMVWILMMAERWLQRAAPGWRLA